MAERTVQAVIITNQNYKKNKFTFPISYMQEEEEEEESISQP
jgi:hypothetical protein